jgi:secretion/DNA translocation related TadE-like protein
VGKGSEGGAAALAVPIATVLVLAAILALADLGALMVARARAQTAADAAALAAAVEIALGSPGRPREQAGRLARANGARLVTCRCPPSAGVGTVVVEVDVPFRSRLLPRPVRIAARARADASAPARTVAESAFAERRHADVVSRMAVLPWPPLVSAWSRTAPNPEPVILDR